jgi:hypothetical protein
VPPTVDCSVRQQIVGYNRFDRRIHNFLCIGASRRSFLFTLAWVYLTFWLSYLQPHFSSQCPFNAQMGRNKERNVRILYSSHQLKSCSPQKYHTVNTQYSVPFMPCRDFWQCGGWLVVSLNSAVRRILWLSGIQYLPVSHVGVQTLPGIQPFGGYTTLVSLYYVRTYLPLCSNVKILDNIYNLNKIL